MMNTELDVLTGERVLLRMMEEKDASYIVKWRNDPQIKKWMFNQEPLTIEAHLEWFKKDKPNRLDYIICDRSNHQPIGTVNFINIKKNQAEAGKMLGNKLYWGAGYAKEAFLIWLNYGFTKFGFSNVFIRTIGNNINNIKLNEKIGFITIDSSLQKINDVLELKVTTMKLSKGKFYEKYSR